MWTDSTIVLQWINSTNQHQIFIANRVSEMLVNNSVDQWNHATTCDNSADAGIRGMPADVLHFNSWVRILDFWRTKKFPFVPNTDVVDNIKLGVVTKEQKDVSISSLAASVFKPLQEQIICLFLFNKFSSYQKLLPVSAYMLRFLPSHESYRIVDVSIADPVELDEAERHIQYVVHGESYNTEKEGIFLTTNSLGGATALLSLLRFWASWPHPFFWSTPAASGNWL